MARMSFQKKVPHTTRAAVARIAPLKEVMGLIEKLKTQRGILIEHAVVPGANHFFENRVDELIAEVGAYLDRRLDNPVKRPTPAKALKGPAAEG